MPLNNKTIELIKKVSGVFGDTPDALKLMLGTAAVESNFGTNPKTYRKGYYGGLMQVDKPGFNATLDTKSHPNLRKYYPIIKKNFNINWPTVRWQDLKNPLHSIIAARLYYKINPKKIPSDRQGRALYWKNHYNTKYGKGKVSDYLKRGLPNLSQIKTNTYNKYT